MIDMYSIYEFSYNDAKELLEAGATDGELLELLEVYEYCPATLMAICDVLERKEKDQL